VNDARNFSAHLVEKPLENQVFLDNRRSNKCQVCFAFMFFPHPNQLSIKSNHKRDPCSIEWIELLHLFQ
jgi:hypothetical protein